MTDATLRLKVKVVPGASREGIAGWLGDALKIRVAVPPEKGKANQAVCRLLAVQLGVADSQVQTTASLVSPSKTLEIRGLTLDELTARLPRKLEG